jgi:hypothetical protein
MDHQFFGREGIPVGIRPVLPGVGRSYVSATAGFNHQAITSEKSRPLYVHVPTAGDHYSPCNGQRDNGGDSSVDTHS